MERQVFVARERELAQLNGSLKHAVAGQGQVCFLAGEAGSGKTTLMREFARRAQEQYADLAVAVGQSDAQTGEGDAHLPFREILAQLTGDLEAKLAQGAITAENADRLRKLLVLSGQALVEVGPDLIGIFVPGAGLATRIGAFVVEKVGWLEKLEKLAGKTPEPGGRAGSGLEASHIFEQYGNVLARLAEKRPLLLVLDDVQWADTASLALLFRLGRRIGGCRILIVAMYRPEEVALGRAGQRHPLEKVLAEFKRYFGESCVDLDSAGEREGRRFVNALLNSEPNRLTNRFRQKLYQHTGGQPLFTIELLRAMQERGDLVQDQDGHWVETPALDWTSLPERVEGVIEERIGRLEHQLRQMLSVGSVEGEEFTAEVVARVQAIEARGLVRRLSGELERQHRLVMGQGMRTLDPTGQRLSPYRFQHNLFRTYLYRELDEAERAYLHEDVGRALEELYGERRDEIAVQLALHFDHAGAAAKASHYMQRAGEQATARFANDEAIAHLSRGLVLTPRDGRDRRYALLLAREQVYGLQGQRELQAQDLADLQELASILGDDRKRAEVALRRAGYALATSDYPGAIAAAGEAIALAEAGGDIRAQATGHLRWGGALEAQGDYTASRRELTQALALSRLAGMHEVEASSQRSLGLIAKSEGDYDQAAACMEESLRICRGEGDRVGESRSLMALGGLFQRQERHARARDCYEQALAIARETGNRRLEGSLLGNLGIDAEMGGEFAAAMERFEQVAAVFHLVGDRSAKALAWAHLGFNAALQGGYERGRAYCEQALETYRDIGDRQGEVYAQGILSWLLCQAGHLDQAEAEGEQALHLAQTLGIAGYEATAWSTLARIHECRGDTAQAAGAYRQGLELFLKIGAGGQVVEGWAGLARVAAAQGDLSQAGELVDKILSQAEQSPIQVANDDPLVVYLTCYQVLRARNDARAGDILRTAQGLLEKQASSITDPLLRRSYLEDVHAPREIAREAAEMGLAAAGQES